MTTSTEAFALHGIREILESYAEAPPLIETLVANTEEAIVDESPTVFELSKALIDSTCKTILVDRGIETSRSWDTPQLLRETQNQLNFAPAEHPNPQVFRAGMAAMLRGLQQAIQGLCELRNSEGIISHGQDGYRQIVFLSYQLQFAARAADAIVHFLFSAHRRNLSGSRAGRIHYEDNLTFNDYLDEIHEGIVVCGQFFSASTTLFNSDADHVAYKEELLRWQTDVEAEILTSASVS